MTNANTSHPEVIVPKFLVKSPEILIKSVCNIPRSFSLDETKSAHQVSNISCS